ncbi:Mediator of RNA polymerase II transcription subunit 21, partial [Glycine soja]
FIGSLISGLLKYTWFLLQFDALVAALPISVSGEEAQLKRISELQAENDAIGQELQKQLEAAGWHASLFALYVILIQTKILKNQNNKLCFNVQELSRQASDNCLNLKKPDES